MLLNSQRTHLLCKAITGQTLAKDWDESKHPRGGQGTQEGGRFVSGGGTPAAEAGGGEAAGASAGPAKVPAQKPDGEVATGQPAGDGKQAVSTQSPLESMKDKFTGSGTKTDPIVTKDVLVAAAALHEDKYVKLDSVKQVSTLLDRLKTMVDEAKAAGQKAKNYDLCKVSVPGTNLFCAESKGIPRVQMPQLKAVPTPGSKADALSKNKDGEVDISKQFVQHLNDAGIGVTQETERADYLKASQNELNGGKVAGMVAAIESGKNTAIRDEPIFCSRDNYIVDGHHRWAACVGVGTREGSGPVKMNVLRVDMPIIELLKASNNFAGKWGLPQAAVTQVQKSKCGENGCCVNLTDAELIAIFADKG